MQSLQQEVCQMIWTQLDDEDKPEMEELLEKNLINDLGFDSIQLVDMIFSLEEKYGLQITDMGSFLESLKSVRELIYYIENSIQLQEQGEGI